MRNGFSSYRLTVSLLILVALLITAGCGSGRRYEDLPMDAAWQKIMKDFNKEKYLDAIDRLEMFLINYSGSALADSAQYILAESHFNIKEYIVSSVEYQKVVVQYPQSLLSEEAEYKMGLSYFKLAPKYSLAQSYSESAIATLQLFIEDYPESAYRADAEKMIKESRAKLARKEFMNGRLYQKMGELKSARIYYDLVLENYYDTIYAPDAQYYKALSFEKAKSWRDAIREYQNYLQKYPDHDYETFALEAINRARMHLEEEQLLQQQGK